MFKDKRTVRTTGTLHQGNRGGGGAIFLAVINVIKFTYKKINNDGVDPPLFVSVCKKLI